MYYVCIYLLYVCLNFKIFQFQECMYVCMYVCMYKIGLVYVCIYLLCIYLFIYVCMYVSSIIMYGHLVRYMFVYVFYVSPAPTRSQVVSTVHES